MNQPYVITNSATDIAETDETPGYTARAIVIEKINEDGSHTHVKTLAPGQAFGYEFFEGTDAYRIRLEGEGDETQTD